MTRANPGIIYRPKNFPVKGRLQQQKTETGECAKHDCHNAAITCPQCGEWWKLGKKELASYRSENPHCPGCQHSPIIHSFFCKEHQHCCLECEQDHPRLSLHLGCPFRRLREGKPILPEHEDWLRKRIGEAKGKELLLFLFGDGKGRIHATKSKNKHKEPSRFGSIGSVMKLLEAMHNRQVQSYEGWERSMSPDRRKHSHSDRTKAGMKKARAAGKRIGRPPRNSK